MKQLLKRLLPKELINRLVGPYHLLEAVAASARYGFPTRGMYVVQITGTNGKTTTSSFVASILKAAGHRVGVVSTAYFEIAGERIPNDKNFTNMNPRQLQPLLAQMRRAKVTHLVLEVTSIGLDQYRVWGIPCNAAVMTNLTQDHLDYHQTMENYAAAKSKLFARKPALIALNRDDEWFDYFNQFEAGEQKITYGTHDDADCRIKDVKLHQDGSDVKLDIDHQYHLKFHTQLPGKFNVYNATAAAAITYLMHIEAEDIEAGIAALEMVPGRLEPVDAGQAFQVFVDYAHTPDALQNVLETLRHLTKNRIIVVFGATGDRDKGKRPIMGEIVANLADRVFVTDDETYTEDAASIRSMIMEGIKKAGGEAKTEEVADRREAIEKAIKLARGNDTVLITGMGHEQYRIMNGKREPWNDAKVAREVLEA
ncbi:MAG TPA: UDP-N-acetylmuramoyl-L-alanyl-D-glutamate--2,6-diaminopimelate ligase [Candidatus Acidoferrum sp.]|nr:UDP-N-acetylmuramoyl-L-alanyl-D-glutamate--2,6-diaminopimelate ligase [Candidatus Acidoferrum sp.]